jgi:tRNA(Ile)-lysidine synthase
MAGRKLRHEFFARSAAKLRLKTLALAHHADDQVELFFLRLFRGTGPDGLTGMKWTSVLNRAPGLRIVRPLLNEFKSTLIEFAKTEHIAYREDASNLQPEFQRNRLRTELLPLLKRDYQPSLNTVILRLMDLTAAETHYLDAVAKEWFSAGKGTKFDELHVAVQRRVLQLQLISKGILPNYDLVEQLRLTPNRPEYIDHRRVLEGSDLKQMFETGEPFAIARAPDGVVYVPRTKPTAFNSSSKSLKLAKPRGTASFNGLNLRWNYSKSCKLFENSPGVECFDAEKIGPAIILRHWLPGDRFHPIGMKTSMKLQDYFTNQKMPRDARRFVVVATNQQGMVFWVEGLRISETCKITPATRLVLRWKWKRLLDAV